MTLDDNARLRELTGERVTLSQFTDEYFPALIGWRSDPEVTRFWITQHVPTLDDLTEWLESNRRSGSLTWVILDERRDPIGYTDVFNLSVEHRHCEIAFMIGERSRWGKGYARESLMVLLDYLYRSEPGAGLGMHKVSLAVFAENNAARHLYEACGFREDGIFREDMYRDGYWHDQILMSMLDREFYGQSTS